MPEYNWMYYVYGKKPEEFMKDLPTPKGKKVHITTFTDSSLGACKVTGKSLTGISILVNQSPVDWYSNYNDPWNLQLMDQNLL